MRHVTTRARLAVDHHRERDARVRVERAREVLRDAERHHTAFYADRLAVQTTLFAGQA